MKIGVLTGIWYIAESASLIESLRRAGALGFRCVDIHGVFHGGPAHLNPEERRLVGQAIHDLGLTPRNYVLHAPKNPAAATPEEQEQNVAYLCEGVDLAVAWGMHQIMLNAGQWDYTVLRPDAWKRSVEFLQRVCDYAATKSVFIAQEPEPYVWFLVNDLPSAARMMAEVNRDNFTLLVDLGHLGLSRENPGDLEAVKSAIIHAHFSDHQANLHTNQVIGTGVTPAADYLAALQNLQIDRLMERYGEQDLVISLELGVPGDRIADPDDWVRRSLQHLRQIAPFLSQT
jgi:sugar phosphate isomerase/epimerase